MMEIKKVVEVLKEFNDTIFTNTPEIVEAVEVAIQFLSKLQDAEMPKKKDYQEHSYYELYDEWLAYHTKKMTEVLDVERIARVIHRFNQGLCVNCNELARAIAEEIGE